MKKFTAMAFAGMMALSLMGCSSAAGNETAATTAAEAGTETTISATEAKPETIIIQGLNEKREQTDVVVPYDPQRIAVLDMPALDILDSLDLGDRIVGSAKVSIEYLTQYNPEDSDGAIANLGSVKTADFEQIAICEPDIIFIGGRLSESYDELSEIAPVVQLGVDYEKGILQSTEKNAKKIASIFGLEEEIDGKLDGYQTRMDALREVLNEKTVLLSMYNNNAMSIMDTNSQLNLVVKVM